MAAKRRSTGRSAKQVAAQKKASAASAAKRKSLKGNAISSALGPKARAFREAGNAFSQHGMGGSGKARRVANRVASGYPKKRDLRPGYAQGKSPVGESLRTKTIEPKAHKREPARKANVTFVFSHKVH